MEERSLVWGPTYAEMLDPSTLPEETREQARRARNNAEPAAINLFNITWCDERGRVRAIQLPPELTGVEANILVLVGKPFPSGSHKIGPAYAGLMEAELDGAASPGRATLVCPSTGNFGIGVAYVARAKGYRALVVMPEGLSEERQDWIRRYGADLEMYRDRGDGISGLLESTLERYGRDPAYLVQNQFAMLANYRFHRHVTGRSALEAASGFGDGRVAAFVAGVGSAGTLAAGDEIKARFGDALVVALEPREAPYLAESRQGAHHIEGIGDALISLIHNVLSTDYVALVDQDDCLQGLAALQAGPSVLTRLLGVPEAAAQSLVDLFGVSSVCNILGAIKVARALRIPAGRNVVTIATDGYERYASVIAGLPGPAGAVDQAALRLWAGRVFRPLKAQALHDLRPTAEKERLLRLKQELWTRLGWQPEYLKRMEAAAFWEEECARVADYDRRLSALRASLLQVPLQ